MTLDTQLPPAPTAEMSGRRTLLIRMAIGVGIGMLFVLIFLQLIDFGSAWRRVEHLNVALALLCGVVFLSAYAVRALRWRLFLAPDEIAARRVIGIYFIATFLNWLLPVQGGELAKSLILRRSNGIPVSRSLATVTMDKTMDLLPAVVLLAFVPLAGLRLSGALWLLLVFALLMLATGRFDFVQISLAWVFVVARTVHAFVHIAFNYVPLRFAAFVGGVVTLAVIWTRFAQQNLS